MVLLAAAPSEAAQLKAVQSGTASLGSSSTSTTATLSPAVDTSKAFLVFSFRVDSDDPDDATISGQITNGTTVTFQRVGPADVAASIEWYVAEFTSGVTVQRGSRSVAGSASHIVGISSVDLTKSFPIVSYRADDNNGPFDEETAVRARLTGSTTLNLSLETAPSGGATVEWQVIEYQGATVQSGDLTFAASPATATVTAVDPARSWLIYTHEINLSGSGTGVRDGLVRGVITNATTLTFDRDSASGSVDPLAWYLVEFGDGTTVQHNTRNFSNASTQQDVTISSVDLTRSIAAAGYLTAYGKSPSAGANPGVGLVTADLTSATNLRLTRALTGSTTADIGWFVVAFHPGYTIGGTVFEDIAGDALLDGAIGGANNPGVGSASVSFYLDNGNGSPGAGDTLVSGSPVSTVAGGAYTSPALADGTYWAVVDSKTVASTQDPAEPLANLWAEQTYGSAGARCSNGAGGTAVLGSAGACYGGQRGAQSDDTAALANAEHVTRVIVSGANVTAIDFGFSFKAVTTARDGDDDVGAANRSVQGSLRQFLQNANAIGAADAMRFVPAVATNASGGGGNWWQVAVSGAVLPAISNSGTTVDGRAYCAWTDGTQGCTALTQIRDPNAGTSGNPDFAGKSVGTGADGIEGTADDPQLPSYERPELELNGSDLGVLLEIAASSTTLRRIALHNYDTVADVRAVLVSAGSGSLVTESFLGPRADGSDPGAGLRLRIAVGIAGGAADVTNCFIGYTEDAGVLAANTALIQGNDLYRSAISKNTGDAVSTEGSTGQTITVRRNRMDRSGAYGFESWVAPGPFTIEDNTVSRSGEGAGVESGGIRVFGLNSTIRQNVVTASAGAGITVVQRSAPGATRRNLITRNAIYTNGSISIDLDVTNTGLVNPIGDGVTPNNGTTDANLPNIAMDYPVFTTASVNGSTLHVVGYVGTAVTKVAGSHTIQIFKAANDGNNNGPIVQGDGLNVPHGEARWFINSCTTAADGTFDCSVAVPAAVPLVPGDAVAGTARTANADTSEVGANFTVTVPLADLALTKSDNPDPAPSDGPLLYTLLITNNGPDTATNVTVTDDLPNDFTLQSATPSQGGCAGTDPVVCNLGAVLSGGTASIEILVVTGSPGNKTNSASVAADQSDPVPANNAASISTQVAAQSTSDIPLSQYRRIHGFIDSTVTGGSLRTQPNQGGNPCLVGANSTAALAGIPVTSTVTAAYLYWAGSGAALDSQVTLDAAALTADRTFVANFAIGATIYDFFGGFEDVTAQVQAKRNGNYTFGGLTVATGNPFCNTQAVLAAWALIVIYEDPSVTGKTLLLYDGFDITRNGSSNYVLTGIYAASPPEAKAIYLSWEGDETLSGVDEKLEFNGTALSDGLNPLQNVYNSTINSLGSTTAYGMDLDSFDVSSLVADRATSATTTVSVAADMMILNAVLLQVKSNIISGSVFEDVNYGGGAGRTLAAATAAAPAFSVPRPGARLELYDTGGNFLRATTVGASGEYGFAGLVDGNYFVRAVNSGFASSRPAATGNEWPVQTYRTDASSGTPVAVTDEVGGASPGAQDSPANLTSANLSTLTAQSVTPVRIITGVAVSRTDFGFNFDTIVNTNDTGQGSLRQFIVNSNALTNANLAQEGQTAGREASLFMLSDGLAHPGLRAGLPSQLTGGVGLITLASALPAITDAGTSLDGTTQTANVGNTNAVALGQGGSVGVDGLGLSQVPGPEIEIVDGAANLPLGLSIAANDTTVRGVSLWGFGSVPFDANHGSLRISSGSGVLLERNILGARATGFADPGAGRTVGSNAWIVGGTGIIRENLIGYASGSGIELGVGSGAYTVSGNELVGNGVTCSSCEGLVARSTGHTIRGNRVAANRGSGIDLYDATAALLLENNTVTGNGIADPSNETAGIRVGSGSGARVELNIASANYGAGVMVVDGTTGVTISRNSTFANGTIVTEASGPMSGQIGIDLLGASDDSARGTAPFVTLNDTGDPDTGGNTLLNDPVILDAVVAGPDLTVTGFARPGSTLEFFLTDGDPSGFGEGQTYLFTAVEGSGADLDAGTGSYGPGPINGSNQGTDTTARFRFVVPTPPAAVVGSELTATATDAAGNTSEFGGLVVAIRPGVVKRAFLTDGTPLANGAPVPDGTLVKFLIYVNARGAEVGDVSLQDVLAPAFQYVPGSIRFGTSTPCAAASCTPAEEQSLLAAVDAGSVGTEAVDGDVVSFAGTTIDVGDAAVPNAPLDISAGTSWGVVFTVLVQ